MVVVIRWSVDLGKVDILLDTALMSTYLTLPPRGNLEHIFHVFGHLMVNPKRKFCFDPQHPWIYERLFAAHCWYYFYRDAKEAILVDSPTPRGNMVSTHFFVDADHAGDRATRIPQNGVLIFLTRHPYNGIVSDRTLLRQAHSQVSSFFSIQQLNCSNPFGTSCGYLASL